jgi:cytochrome c5
MKLKILTLLPTLVMVFLVIHGLNEGMSAQQSGAPSAQSATPPDKSVPAPVQSTPPPSGNALPPGPGQATTARICTGCHAVTVITSMRKSADDWAGIVDEMRSRGANGTDEEFDQISAYLAANFGPATHPTAGTSVPNP